MKIILLLLAGCASLFAQGYARNGKIPATIPFAQLPASGTNPANQEFYVNDCLTPSCTASGGTITALVRWDVVALAWVAQGGIASGVANSTVAGLPASCSPGEFRFVTNATISGGGMYFYFCNNSSAWVQFGYVSGGSGALIPVCTSSGCTIDVTADIMRKASLNVLTGGIDISGGSFSAPFRLAASDPATCDATKGEFYLNTTSRVLKQCDSANHWAIIGGGSTAIPNLSDDFCGGNSISQDVGTLGYKIFFNTTTPGITYTTGESGHFCAMQVVTSSAAGEATAIYLGGTGSWNPSATTFKHRLVFKTDSSTTGLTRVFTGMGAYPSDGAWLIFDPAIDATNFRLATCNASTCTNTSTTVAYANSTWFDAVIDSVVAGTYRVTVNGTTVGGITSNVPSTVNQIVLIAPITNSNARTFLVDKFEFTTP